MGLIDPWKIRSRLINCTREKDLTHPQIFFPRPRAVSYFLFQTYCTRNPTLLQTKNVIFHTRFQTWPLTNYVITASIQSTPDNSNLQGKSKKVRVIGSLSYREFEENSCEYGKKQFLLYSEHFNHI